VSDIVGDNPQMAEIFAQLGGARAIVDAYIAAVLGIVGLVAAVYAVQAVLRLRSEEINVRAETVLATRVTRLPWAASHVIVAIVGTALLLAVAGGTMGLVHGLRIGDVAGELPRVVGGALAQLPAALVLAGIALTLFGTLPRMITIAWALVAATLVISQLGPMLQFDQWVLNLAPFSHVPPLPGGEMTWTPLLWLTGVAAVSMALGLAGLRRRDIGVG
jgi:ABC-2 type transport system permease protein